MPPPSAPESVTLPTLPQIRAQFPALGSRTVFLDNAGGSQVPAPVIDRVRRYFTDSYVQLGADYDLSRAATATVARAHELAKMLVNAPGQGEVVLGPSTTALVNILANAYADSLRAGRLRGRDEIVVCTAGHEANVGPWMRLAARGFTVKPWHADRGPDGAWGIRTDDLRPLLTSRTALVAFPHVSNLLGEIYDAKAITRLAHEHGARTVVDGVAFAPHRAIDVAAWGCDWYVYSTYKVFGPHLAALFGTHGAFSEITGPNHDFIDAADLPYKFELGGVSHEGCAALLGSYDYLEFLANGAARSVSGTAPFDRAVIERAFETMTQLELPLQRELIAYLKARPDVTIDGPVHAERSRVPTISFRHARQTSAQIARAGNAEGLGFRHGSLYSVRLCETMGIDPDDGVVRISLLHYNTMEEVRRLIGFFDRVLKP